VALSRGDRLTRVGRRCEIGAERDSGGTNQHEEQVKPVQGQPSNLRIAGVALLLFSAVLLGVGIHHLFLTGTCSSTGYSANYGPVPTCPSGTGAWFAFVFGGIIGAVAGALMAGSSALVFAGIFGAIGLGSLSILLDSGTQSGQKIFGAIFGGCFALVGAGAAAAVISSAVSAMRSPNRAAAPATPRPVPATVFGTPQAASAFGAPSQQQDPILSAYEASRTAPASSGLAPAPPPRAPSLSPLGLIPGLQAARASTSDPVQELTKLADLHQKGALTDVEFAKAKANLLGHM
jgi:hypothetical protein